jgi:hypothetical protein
MADDTDDSENTDLEVEQEENDGEQTPVVAAPRTALPVVTADQNQAPATRPTSWAPAPGAQPVSAAPYLRAPGPVPGQQLNKEWAPAPGAQPVSIATTFPQKTDKSVSLKDYGKAAWASAVQGGEALVSAASFAARKITEDPELVGYIEKGRHALGDYASSIVTSMSPAAQQALRASLFGGGQDESGNHIPSPGEVGWARYAGMAVASFVPDAVMLVVPGGVAGKFVEKIAPKLIGEAARVGTTGTLFGAQQAGEAYSTLVDQVDHAKPDEMMGSPVYAHARQQGMSDLDAKRLVVEKFTPYFAAQFGVGAVTGAGAGSLLTRGAMGAAGASVGRRAAIGAAEGAGTMGVQAGAGNALQQAASQDAGLQKEFDPHKMAESFASGALGGALLGAVGGAAHRGARPRTTEEEPQPEQAPTLALPSPDHMQPEQQAALSETLALPKPETIYGPETPWTSTGGGMIPGRGSFTARPSDGVTPTPAPEPQQRLLPKPQTGYGEGFTMPPEGTPAVPLDKQLPAPEQRSAGALPSPGLARGVQGDQFTVSRQEPSEPARPSGGMNRGNLVDALVKQGQDAQKLRRMKIGELRDAYDQAQTPPEAARQQFRPGVGEVPLPSDHPVDKAAAAASEPSEAQKEAGNYQKGHVSIQGLDISIENPKGSTRKGPIDKVTGKPAWEAEMPAHYGYIRGTVGGDGEHVDVHLGPRTKALFDGTPADAAREPVYVVDQIDPATGKFDEHKALLGFHTGIEATRAYDAGFTDGSGPSRRGHVSEMTFPEFKEWLRNSDTTKPVAYKKPTVGDQLKAKRATEKQRMAEPMMSLLKRDQVKPRIPEVRIEEEPEENGARAEVESQPVRYESDRNAPATVVEQPAPKPRSPKSTDKTRQLKDLEDMVVDGTLTATEADKEYGRNERTAGRDRRYEDFASWLRDRIKEAEDPKTTSDLIAKAERLQNDKSLVGAKKIAASREINEALQRTDPEYIQKLKDALADLEDPVKAAADRAERKAKGAAALDKIKALRDAKKKDDIAGASRHAVQALFFDDRINRSLREIIDSRRPSTIHEYLDRITNDPVIKVRLPQAIALARRLKELLPASLEVLPKEIAITRFKDAEGRYPDTAAAGFDPKYDIIFHALLGPRKETASALEVILHEGMHAVTSYYLRHLSANTTTHEILDSIRREFMRASTELNKTLDRAEFHAFQYSLTNNEELHTMLMTSPTIQRIAAEITPSREFREDMAKLGYAPKDSRSLWRAFTGWVRRAVGLPPQIGDSLLDHVLRPLEDITDRAARFNDFYKVRDVPAELRHAAEPAADAAISALPRFDRDTAREALDRIDPKGLSDRGRRSVLQGATTDGIVNWNRELFKTTAGDLLENYRTATEAMAARAKDFRDEWTDKIHGLLGRTSKLGGDERTKLAQLMNDATTTRWRSAPTRLNANDHLKPDQQKVLSALQARYNGFSREAKVLYNSFRDYYRQTYDTEREAQLSGLIKTALPEATPAQVEALTKSSRRCAASATDRRP